MFLLQLALVLLATRGFGYIIKRLGQPSVLGEVLAGVVLGPSLLGLVPPSQSIKDFAELGVILLMFLAGLETDVHELKTTGLPSFLIAVGGVLLPFLAGPLLAVLFNLPYVTGIMLGTILTATSVSISVQTLLDLGQLRTPQGTTILGAAVIDDIMGIIVLTIVVGLTGGAHVSIFLLVLRMVIYFLFAALVGSRLIGRYLRAAVHLRLKEALLSFTLVATLVYAYLAEVSGVAALIGAYLLGVLISRTGFRVRVSQGVETLGYGFLIPMFFASIGLDADLSAIDRGGLLFSLSLVLIAVISKIIGCGLTARVSGFTWRQSLQIGFGMIPRAEVALVIAALALRNAIIDQEMFSSVVLLVIATTVMTPLLLKLSFSREMKARAQV